MFTSFTFRGRLSKKIILKIYSFMQPRHKTWFRCHLNRNTQCDMISGQQTVCKSQHVLVQGLQKDGRTLTRSNVCCSIHESVQYR